MACATPLMCETFMWLLITLLFYLMILKCCSSRALVVSYLLFNWLLHARTHGYNQLVASFMNYTGTYWEIREIIVEFIAPACMIKRLCRKTQGEKKNSCQLTLTLITLLPKNTPTRETKTPSDPVCTDYCKQRWSALAQLSHQMNSLQWKQKVGWRRKVDMNLCPLTWWILRLTAPCRILVNCL